MAYGEKKLGGLKGYGRPRRGSGGLSPPPDEGGGLEEFSKYFRKVAKYILRKLQKMHFQHILGYDRIVGIGVEACRD